MPWKSPGIHTISEIFFFVGPFFFARVGRFTYAGLRDSYIFGSREYLPELARARAAREKSLQDVKEVSLSRFMSDLAVDRAKNPSAALNDRWESEEEEENEDLNVDIIDQSAPFDSTFSHTLTG